MLPVTGLQLIFFLAVAGVPAYFMNRYLLQLVQPRQSTYRFLAYLIILLAAGFLYSFIICWLIFKYA